MELDHVPPIFRFFGLDSTRLLNTLRLRDVGTHGKATPESGGPPLAPVGPTLQDHDNPVTTRLLGRLACRLLYRLL